MQKQEAIGKLKGFISTHNGKPVDQKALLKPIQMVAKVLIARFLSMPPEQQQAIKGIVTPETTQALKILLPELVSLLNKGNVNG